MKKQTLSNITIMFVMIMCTITIIGTNYTFTQKAAKSINDQILENEYNRIGGKDNYLILQEIQKQEVLKYLEQLRQEQPDLIEQILNKKESEYNVFTQNVIDDLKQNSYIAGNQDATITMIEFSDLECKYCIDYHRSGIRKNIQQDFGENINYIYKHFPLPTHKNSYVQSEATKCVENLTDGETYLNYIDAIYSETKGGGEGLDLEYLSIKAIELGIDEEKFNSCYTTQQFKQQVQAEFQQGISLGINSVPAHVFINNTTGEHVIVSEVKKTAEYKNIIEKLLN